MTKPNLPELSQFQLPILFILYINDLKSNSMPYPPSCWWRFPAFLNANRQPSQQELSNSQKDASEHLIYDLSLISVVQCSMFKKLNSFT